MPQSPSDPFLLIQSGSIREAEPLGYPHSTHAHTDIHYRDGTLRSCRGWGNSLSKAVSLNLMLEITACRAESLEGSVDAECCGLNVCVPQSAYLGT